MKKAFDTPSVEAAALSPLEDVMFGIMLTSAGQNPEGFREMSDEAAEGFAQWKGFTD